ncbi:MAG: hypothetical protein HUU15_08725 [Candidatus Brocadiae bacterium]|nr:hypothetical protein [Candidatus Brocadiia bacterium]
MSDDATKAIQGGLGEAWTVLKPHLVPFAIATLLGALIGGFSFYICLGPMIAGWYYMCFKAKRGEKVEIGDLFKGFERFVDYLVLGLFTVIVPFGFLITWWAFPYCVDKKADFMTSLKFGLNFFLKHLVPTIIAFVIFVVLYIVGLITCGLGLLVVIPLFHMYLTLYYLAHEAEIDPNAKPEVKT